MGLLDSAKAGNIKWNLEATVDPTANEDAADGYGVGSLWMNVTDDKVFIATDVTVASAVWKDLSATDSNTGALVNMGGGTQAISDSTWTKVQFDTEDHDTGSQYDAVTNFRFTPGVSGLLSVSAGVTFNVGTDGGRAAIAVYENDTLLQERWSVLIGGGGDQALFISIPSIQVALGTDYYDIRVQQTTGSSLNVDGTNSETFASYLMH